MALWARALAAQARGAYPKNPGLTMCSRNPRTAAGKDRRISADGGGRPHPTLKGIRETMS